LELTIFCFRGVYYYYQAAKDARMVVEYGAGTPNDWVERKLYTKHNFLGVVPNVINKCFIVWLDRNTNLASYKLFGFHFGQQV
jgi:phage-related holin